MSLHDPQRALSVLEMNVRGRTLQECGREFGISGSRCGQLILMALHLLRELPPVQADNTRPNWRAACLYWDAEERRSGSQRRHVQFCEGLWAKLPRPTL